MPIFDSEWRKTCSVRRCSINEVDVFIKAHYLRRRPAIIMLCLIVEHCGVPIGCIVYSAPPREAEKRYGGKVWELSRLFLLDEIPKNAETWVIGKSIRWIKKYNKEVKFLLSYADPSVGHNGTIYKAANWRQDGKTDSERKTPRCDYYDEKTGKKYGRRGNMPKDAVIVKKPRISKWRFIMEL
jgi:hypothetical protein